MGFRAFRVYRGLWVLLGGLWFRSDGFRLRASESGLWVSGFGFGFSVLDVWAGLVCFGCGVFRLSVLDVWAGLVCIGCGVFQFSVLDVWAGLVCIGCGVFRARVRGQGFL